MNWTDKLLRGFGVQRIQNLILTGNSDNLAEIFSIEPSFAGPAVSPESAMRLSVVYACTRLIAGAIASLPIKVYEDGNPVRKGMPYSILQRVFNERPTERFTAAAFWEFIVTSMLLRGDGFAYLERNGNGQVIGAVPVHADSVIVQREVSGAGTKKVSRLTYTINDNGDMFTVQQDDMLHFPGFGYGFGLGYGYNSLRGMSVVRYAVHQAVGIALAAEETSARFFGGGMTPKYVLQAEGKLTDDQVVKLRESWDRRYSGSANAGKPLILTEGLKAETLSLSSSDAQLLDSRKFQVVDIARAFGVPPHMVGDMEKTTSWGTGIGEMNVGFLTYTLQPHLTRFEQEINAKCFSSRTSPRQFVEFNVRGLLRADAKAQNEAYRQSVGGSQGPGWMTRNEIRALNNDPPLPEGDVLYDPAKQTTPGAANNAPA